MQGFRTALLITSLVTLGLGSNLAWHYPRPAALGHPTTPSVLTQEWETLESSGIRCRPNPDWSDLLVESARLDEAQKNLKEHSFSQGDLIEMATPPELLADLGRLPGVKEASVWIHGGHEAVVVLSMGHGAYAGDPNLLDQVVEKVRTYAPTVEASNVKVLDQNGGDLTYLPLKELQWPARTRSLQKELQSLADAGAGGPRRALVFCRFVRAEESRIHLQVSLRLVRSDPQLQQELTQNLSKELQARTEKLNAMLKGKDYLEAITVLYRGLGESTELLDKNRIQLERDRGILLDDLEVKEWSLRERSLTSQEVRLALWGLTPSTPTPWQLGTGLLALGPALFGWSLLLPWLIQRHRLRLSN